MKYLGMSLTVYVQALCEQNYETFIKEIKEEQNKWKDISCSWIKRQYCQDVSFLNKKNAMQFQSKSIMLWISTN